MNELKLLELFKDGNIFTRFEFEENNSYFCNKSYSVNCNFLFLYGYDVVKSFEIRGDKVWVMTLESKYDLSLKEYELRMVTQTTLVEV